jgi:hypothetical protein
MHDRTRSFGQGGQPDPVKAAPRAAIAPSVPVADRHLLATSTGGTGSCAGHRCPSWTVAPGEDGQRWLAINAYGIQINHRTKDAGLLNPLTCGQPSGMVAKNNWVRDLDRGWTCANRKHRDRMPTQFRERPWTMFAIGSPRAGGVELADAATALLRIPWTGCAAGSGAQRQQCPVASLVHRPSCKTQRRFTATLVSSPPASGDQE